MSLPGVGGRCKKTGPLCGLESVGDSGSSSACQSRLAGVDGAACDLEGVAVENEIDDLRASLQGLRSATGFSASGGRLSGVCGGLTCGDDDAATAC